MHDTGFNPPAAKRARIAPTEVENGQPLRGVVHDPRARRLGGVAGHAGLFTTAADLARFARLLLAGGELDGVRLFQPETVRLMTSVQTPPGLPRRGLGWDIDSPYAGPRGELFPLGSYGHTGWTGTSIWIDPFSRTFVIFLSNRNHPTEAGNVIALRRAIGTLAAQAVVGFNFSYVPGALPPEPGSRSPAAATTTAEPPAPVLNGIDVLVKRKFAPLRGLRVGLITNQTGHDRARRPTIDLLRSAPDVRLVALFSPEHGLRGSLDEAVGDTVDEPSGLPVYSLYGETRAPRPAQLAPLDALVFDVQDIGCRFYTYISTLGLCLEAAAQAGKKFFVLDRVNPINGLSVEGPVHTGPSSFVAFHRLPLRHGMTVGELARLFNRERGWQADLTVIPVEGWSRAHWLDQTGLPWTNPSPNMRRLTAAILYPGVGLLESAVSVGRGTDTPFEIVGAPYVDDVRFAEELARAGVPGVRYVPIRFTPRASTFKDQPCGGVLLVLTNRDALDAVDLGLTLALTLRRLYPDQFALGKLRPLLTDAATLTAIEAGKPLADIRRGWSAELAAFQTTPRGGASLLRLLRSVQAARFASSRRRLRSRAAPGGVGAVRSGTKYGHRMSRNAERRPGIRLDWRFHGCASPVPAPRHDGPSAPAVPAVCDLPAGPAPRDCGGDDAPAAGPGRIPVPRGLAGAGHVRRGGRCDQGAPCQRAGPRAGAPYVPGAGLFRRGGAARRAGPRHRRLRHRTL
ncbi:MAG: DUF1343 domain-containing protein [Verrucomicrobia bacterium]|nr:DUF1343 domain-containing protein [Verrucomicrobiota bacterium]